MNNFDLASRLNPQHLKPQGVAFDAASVSLLQEQSGRRRQTTIEVMRTVNTTDETGGQSTVGQLVGQYSAWIQEITNPQESTPVIGNTTETKTRYLVGVIHDADVQFSDELATPGWTNAWQPATNYVQEVVVIPLSPQSGNGHVYICTKPGVSGAEEPVWRTQPGAVVADGSCVWREAGEIHYLQVIGDDSAKSTPAEKILICEEIR